MVFVLEGTGIQMINDHYLPYGPNKLFLIFPQDKHGFEVHGTTTFGIVRFHDSFLKTRSKEWIQKMEYIFHQHPRLPGCVLRTVSDKPLVRAIMHALLLEKENDFPHQEQVVLQLIQTIITIAARNMSLVEKTRSNGTPHPASPLLQYIHANIYSPENLRIERLAAHFNFSPTYLGEYVKKHLGESLQQYIAAYKLKLVETRLRYTDMRINEIAEELGFTDESHLNKMFKKYMDQSPTEFRRGLSALSKE